MEKHPTLTWTEKKIFKSEISMFNWQHLLQLNCHIFHCSDTNKNQTQSTDSSCGYQFKLGNHAPPDCLISCYPTHCRAGENQKKKAGNNHATESVAFFPGNKVVSIKFLKTPTDKAPQCSHNQPMLGSLCILDTRKNFLNFLFLATYSAHYFYFTHCGHCRLFPCRSDFFLFSIFT